MRGTLGRSVQPIRYTACGLGPGAAVRLESLDRGRVCGTVATLRNHPQALRCPKDIVGDDSKSATWDDAVKTADDRVEIGLAALISWRYSTVSPYS
jgi:hypothetical protein